MEITREIVHKLFDYDPDTGELKWKYRSDQTRGSFNQLYAGKLVQTTNRHVQIYHVNYPIANICWLHYYGEPVPEMIDHIDTDGMNNKPNNWRAATRSQNNANQKMRKDNISGIKGITINKYGSFVARVQHQGIEYGKTFKDIDQAIIWRQITYEKLFGEFARHG